MAAQDQYGRPEAEADRADLEQLRDQSASPAETPPANAAAMRERERANEHYRHRGRRAVSGDTVPLDPSDDAPNVANDETGNGPSRPAD